VLASVLHNDGASFRLIWRTEGLLWGGQKRMERKREVKRCMCPFKRAMRHVGQGRWGRWASGRVIEPPQK
jgi:hypothetical protein